MKPQILLVEDNIYIRENTAELIELHSYNVLTASNGVEGMKLALKEKPELILCDIKMPVMDGFDLLLFIRKEQTLAHSKFIFLTASAEKNQIEKALQMGADDYIVKPYTEKELLGKLKKHLQ